MKVSVRKWTCTEHDYPQQCEACETWHCEECRLASWVVVGERDASVWEEMLYQLPSSLPPRGQGVDKEDAGAV